MDRGRHAAASLFGAVLLTAGLIATGAAAEPSPPPIQVPVSPAADPLPAVPAAPGQDGSSGNPATSPGQTCTETAPSAAGSACDTEVTPVAKETDLWHQAGGAKFPDLAAPEGSPTPVEADLFAVGFLGSANGFAGGAICDQPVPAGAQENDAVASYLDGCNRIPAIYSYAEPPGQPGTWSHSYTADPADGPGFVGAIAWLKPGEALAVGGGGTYPRREQEIDPVQAGCVADPNDPTGTDPSQLSQCEDRYRLQNDPAGAARAWLFENGSWEEITDQLPPGMGALTALDCAPDGSGLCYAGGMHQLWAFKDGSFTQEISPEHSSDAKGNALLAGGASWHYRVRQIRFNPSFGNTNATTSGLDVIAVTAGCCSELRSQETPRILVYDGTKWSVHLFSYSDTFGGPGYATELQAGCEQFIVKVCAPDTRDAARDAAPPDSLADSLYALSFSRWSGGWLYDNYRAFSLVAAPGGPAAHYPGAEPGSQVLGGDPLSATFDTKGSGPGSDLLAEALHLRLSPARLVAGGTDEVGRMTSYGLTPAGQDADGYIDWAVGELRGSGQAAAFTTTGAGRAPMPITCQASCTPDSNPAGKIDPGQLASQSLFGLDSYALNAFAMIPGTGSGWAVGDKGAIEQLGGEAAAAARSEPSPPKLTPGGAQAFPGAATYTASEPPLSSKPGLVPALSSRPRVRLSEPVAAPAGSADPTRPADNTGSTFPHEVGTKIAMSRDGSEGWAVGPYAFDELGSDIQPSYVMTLFHWDGEHWSRCDTGGIPGVKQPDPACASLGALRVYRAPGGLRRVRLTAIARVPLENDSDPTNDNEFEAVAMGTAYGPKGGTAYPTVLRYREGRWSLDREAGRELDPALSVGTGSFVVPISLAFASPTDGWLVVGGSDSASQGTKYLFHFDGSRWANCSATPQPADCGAVPAGAAASADLRLATAGSRVYLYGSRTVDSTNFPLILYLDPGRGWTAADGGYDPGSDASGSGAQSANAQVRALSVTRLPSGSYSGWASVAGGPSTAGFSKGVVAHGNLNGEFGLGSLLHLADGEWVPWQVKDAASDYPSKPSIGDQNLLTLDRPLGDTTAIYVPEGSPMLGFDDRRQRWQVLPVPWMFGPKGARGGGNTGPVGYVRALAPDGRGGVWIGARRDTLPTYAPGEWFYDYTTDPPASIFTDVAHPIREPATAAAAGGDGSLWVATGSGAIYRYGRASGWDKLTVPGWDPGRIVTHPSPVNAIAIGADGSGVAVGPGGRIADLSLSQVRLDAAAGAALCSNNANQLPCGTGYDLSAAAVAPDGSAMVGGAQREVLWRPAGGQFQAISKPPAQAFASISGISMPTGDRAYVVTETGQIFEGDLAGSGWSWKAAGLSADGVPLTLGFYGHLEPLRSIAVDAQGHGYAVGDRGTVLERAPDGSWQRLDLGLLDNLSSVTLPVGGGAGALIGGWSGLLLTESTPGRFGMARPADPYSGTQNGQSDGSGSKIVGAGLLPGTADGEVEAWAVSQVPEDRNGFNARSGSPLPTAVYHYASDPSDPLLDPSTRAKPLPDSPPPVSGELSFAAFGDSNCQVQGTCAEMTGAEVSDQLISVRVAEAIAARSKRAGGPSFALFTGDVSNAAGAASSLPDTPLQDSIPHRRWQELIAQPLAEAGLPLFGAIGNSDLTKPQCFGAAGSVPAQQCAAGANQPWRQAFASMPAPWGAPGQAGPAPSDSGLSFAPVGGGGPAAEPGDLTVPDSSGQLGDQTVPSGGARTHYAFDVTDGSGQRLLRVAVADNSARSLAASDPQQNPAQEEQTWLQGVLCTKGSVDDTPQTPCSREPGERAIVLANVPSYSYDPQVSNGGTETATDATSFEALLLNEQVDAVIDGHLGWNGLYWALAPGLHYPCLGGTYPDPSATPQAGAAPDCQQAAAGGQNPQDGAIGAVEAATGQSGAGALPFVVAASAGTQFGADGRATGDASAGYWHGYTIVRIEPDGRILVEQRPIFDWLGIRAVTQVLRPGQKMKLLGSGREPVGMDVPARYDQIDSAAITHRYDLLYADPDHPWLPASDDSPPQGVPPDGPDNCGPYVCLPGEIGRIDSITGQVKAGKGDHPRVFAIGLLSVADQAATWPLAFEPRASFKPKQPKPTLPRPLVSVAPQPPEPPPVPNPQLPQLNLPPTPTPPILPTPGVPPTATPSAPPPPPPPPFNSPPAPLALTFAPTGLTLAPQSTVVPPPAPPIQPAPPGGARKEARQRQAAAAKSEEGADDSPESGSEAAESDADLAQNRPGVHGASRQVSDATRRDQLRPAPSYTFAADRPQPSAWVRDLEWGGGIALMALVLAFGLTRARPTPRRREPEAPAPAWARSRRHR